MLLQGQRANHAQMDQDPNIKGSLVHAQLVEILGDKHAGEVEDMRDDDAVRAWMDMQLQL